MSNLKTSLQTLLAGLIIVVAIGILDDYGYSYYGFMDSVRSFLKF